VWAENILKTVLVEKDDVTIIMIFLYPSISPKKNKK